jgi:hypothetical protein
VRDQATASALFVVSYVIANNKVTDYISCSEFAGGKIKGSLSAPGQNRIETELVVDFRIWYNTCVHKM